MFLHYNFGLGSYIDFKTIAIQLTVYYIYRTIHTVHTYMYMYTVLYIIIIHIYTQHTCTVLQANKKKFSYHQLGHSQLMLKQQNSEEEFQVPSTQEVDPSLRVETAFPPTQSNARLQFATLVGCPKHGTESGI